MEYRIVRGILFVSPGKEIDHFRAERIIRYTESLLRQQRFRTMVFDLADTVFIIRMQKGIRRIYQMAGLQRIIPSYDDESQFMAAMEGGGKDNEG